MKTEMTMLPNGNYEKVISPIQHQCRSKDFVLECVEYGWEMGKLHLKIEDGDPYEDGYSSSLFINYCPFCGYQPERSKREDSIPEEAAKEFRQFLNETFERRMEIVEQLQKERDAVL